MLESGPFGHDRPKPFHHFCLLYPVYPRAHGDLFYSDQDAAGADAEELVVPMTGHKTAVLMFYQGPSEPRPAQQPNLPFKEFCDSLTPIVRSDENGSTLTAWCKVGDNPIGNEWWSHFLRMRDLGFLIP